jgi:pimeloyl-ACP methyl ester carboxylesterase
MGVEVLHLGGNGHASVRLDRARAALARRCRSVGLVDLPYPGFEGRPRAKSLDAFLDAVAESCRDRQPAAVAAVASGIGALIAIGLRARGELRVPLIFQGPVLWGLERRAFPRLMRLAPARYLLKQVFMLPRFQDRFVHKQFLGSLDESTRRRFFEGYARCSAFGDFFRWFTPGWLRTLERRFAGHPELLGEITVWIGGRDRVVGRREVEVTETVLGVRWPCVVFSGWGHYPMIDVPEEWAAALCDVAGS